MSAPAAGGQRLSLPGAPPRVVLDNIRSAFNVGSIFRTCDAAGARPLYLCGICATPGNPRVVKTALGAEATVPWSHHISTLEVIAQLQAEGVFCVGVERTERSAPYDLEEYPERVAFVFGHEVAGIALPVLERCDRVVGIPMLGRKNSLNVATSVGVMLFEIVRRRLAGSFPASPPGQAPSPSGDQLSSSS
ncbi:MAG: RNA methyltransferase [Candidatus Eisenbacteria bacterium]|nr:RNA methyltransferase [Candidatus Eisenbacteria bacterium]